MTGKTKTKPVILIVIDGWGVAPPSKGNAITQARTPHFERFEEEYPHTLLSASSRAVGLPAGQDGNSEAGHMNIGAGRVVEQDSVIISKSISDGTFFKNPAFVEAIAHVERNDSTLHIMGLLSGDQSGHSHPDHLHALIELAHQSGMKKVNLHLITDGRDSPQYASIGYMRDLKKMLKKFPEVMIASIQGRFYAMDRKKTWTRSKKAYDAIVMGEGIEGDDPETAIMNAYNRGESDEFIRPTVFTKKNKPIGAIKDNDSIIFFNLRSDRARQLTKAFVQPDFKEFSRGAWPKNLRFIAMSDFGPDLPGILTAFPSVDLKGTLPMALVDFRQLYIAESEKYAHVTYFINGGYADPVAGEDRVLIPSPDMKSYHTKPEMSAYQITQVLINNIRSGIYDFYCVNYANPDMVGHTGDLKASIRAVEVVDDCIGKVVSAVLAKKGAVFITGDHGNVEEMINLETGIVNTKHTSNPVPFFIISHQYKELRLRKHGVSGDIAPTILNLFGIKPPKEMTGKTLAHFPGNFLKK
ncbi:MAG: 2,3-bisphosphoglycerate-independent phosphoglycerate mutase [bacterium]|nr:2,3-bisphosphoglycerate-independent phosphoglycerate mutase [bacterium]